jgi:hypothetical protein
MLHCVNGTGSQSFAAGVLIYPRGKQLREKWDMIPDDTEVLMTHGPAYGQLTLLTFDCSYTFNRTVLYSNYVRFT